MKDEQMSLNLNTKPRTVVAIDVGYGNTKVVCSRSPERQGKVRWSELVFPSIAPAVLVNEDQAGFHHNRDRVQIVHNGKAYYTGPKATSGVVPRIIEPNYIATDLHEILIKAAIHFAMRESGRVITSIDMLVLGLPVSGHVAQRDELEELGKRTRTVPIPKALQKGGVETAEVKVKECMAVPQPYGSLRLAAQDIAGDDPLFQAGILSMVVDPGYRTLDWFVSEEMKPEIKLSGSYDGGVSSILREISQRIGYDHGTGSPDFDTVERGLKTGRINLGYKVIDTTPYLDQVVELARAEIGSFVTRMGSKSTNISRVILAGGGASLYEQALRERFQGSDVLLLSDPVMSNARGFWLTGCDVLEGDV
jgi:plasmid segregation protein ParM